MIPATVSKPWSKFCFNRTFGFSNGLILYPNRSIIPTMQVFAVLAIFLSHFLFTDGQSASKIPNVDFLGSGYDIFIGNPYNNLFDPGFRGEVLALTYSQVAMSPRTDSIKICVALVTPKIIQTN